MIIDKVYIINLQHRIDRRENITKELKRVGIENYEFFNAIQATEEDLKTWNKNYIKDIPGWFKKTNGDENKYRLGSLGCMLSHYKIIEKCLENKYTNVLILEDDTEFTFPNVKNFDTFMNIINPQIKNLDFGLLYLTGNHATNNFIKHSNNIAKINNTFTTGSYIVNTSIMEYIVKNMKGYNREVDVYYSEILQKSFPCFCIMPHIAKQGKSFSDIVQMEVNYNLNK